MTAPRVSTIEFNVTSLGTSNSLSMAVGMMPYAATITSVVYIPSATQAGGVAANGRMMSLFNRAGLASSGTGAVTLATLLLTSGAAAGTLNDNIPASLTLTSAAALTLAAGDTLEWHSSHRTSGLEDPGGRGIVTFARI